MENLVCMKAMPMSNLRNTWRVKAVNRLIWVVRTSKIPIGSLTTYIGVQGIYIRYRHIFYEKETMTQMNVIK